MRKRIKDEEKAHLDVTFGNKLSALVCEEGERLSKESLLGQLMFAAVLFAIDHSASEKEAEYLLKVAFEMSWRSLDCELVRRQRLSNI